MHHSEAMPQENTGGTLDFLWLELTNQCNLACAHCYAGSSPQSKDVAPLSLDEQLTILRDSYALGCRKVQFIGGEPTLNKNLPVLIASSRRIGFDFVEVYTNLVRLPDALLRCLVDHEVFVATSVYSRSRQVHDRVTKSIGSFERTMANLRKIIANGLDVRVAVIEMPENEGEAQAAAEFLRNDLGVQRVSIDHVRPFGRANEFAAPDMRDLCGSCAGNILCVSPDGVVSPCIMSKAWSVGSVRMQSLAKLVGSPALASTREQIRSDVKHRHEKLGNLHSAAGTQNVAATRTPDACQPDVVGCPPFNVCEPKFNKSNVGHISSGAPRR